ncbi:MAG: alpha/beta fold hydrolase [Phycisphaerales bacterium]|nr:MAG: alpha/beta fold hydrolase [Phycisphaerales bacterium]
MLFVVSARAQIPSLPPEEELKGRTAGDLVTRLGRYHDGDADWGILFVPENRAVPDSRLTRLVVVRQRAQGKSEVPPVFNLVGGPGDSNVWGSGEFGPWFRQHTDIVRVGYRGIDGSVKLKCPTYARALDTDEPLLRRSIERARQALRSDYGRLRAEGIDLDGYNVVEVADDIEAARNALGYERINLLAVSWGTQIAYVYCRRYPDRVHRVLMIGAGSRARGFGLWEPDGIDRKLRDYAELWNQDADAAARSADLLATIRNVLATLPRQWNDVRIDRDKVRLSTWYLLRETADAARVFDAFVAAEKGDYGGLALLSRGYDLEIARQLSDPHGEYHGEFFCKTMSSGLDRQRDYVSEMDPPGSILGSPAAKLLWGAAGRGGWPVKPIPAEYCRNDPIDAETLVLMGALDFASPHEYVQAELMPCLKRGHLVVLPQMGHTDVVRLQPQAFERLAERFFRDGVVDGSGYREHRIDFTPEDTLQSHAGSTAEERRDGPR